MTRRELIAAALACLALAGAAAEPPRRPLLFPLPEEFRPNMIDSFAELRGRRPHEAVDIMAPRRTPVRAVDDGRIAKLFSSVAGGLTIYHFDPGEQYAYYYAHLEKYAEGLTEGQRVRQGQVLAFVGTSGNAAGDAPHLHFAVFRLGPAKEWWVGQPVDPYPLLKSRR